MFTGLILELGDIISISNTGKSAKLKISAKKTLEELKIGDSVAVNGACLTVVELSATSFTVEAMPETTQNTIIGQLKSGFKVNLERTLRVSDRLDGHIVSGHIDAIGVIASKQQDEIAWRIRISLVPEKLKYILHKGSVAIDGISLTVTAVQQTEFEVSIIPHTLKNTTLGIKKIGDQVNIETDILGKYVERFLQFGQIKQTEKKGISLANLQENGFLG